MSILLFNILYITQTCAIYPLRPILVCDIIKRIMQKNLEATLARLVSFPSVPADTKSCRDIIEYIQQELAPLGLHITADLDRKNPWLIATTKKTMQPATLLAAHVDVVPGAVELFTLERHDEKLVGRGAYDMKFAAACYIEFAKAHKDALASLDIGFMFTTDEEIGGASVVDILTLGWKPGRVLIPDGGDNWHIEERAKGFYGIEVTLNGKTAHGSRPWEGTNAIHALLGIINQLRAEFPDKNPGDATFAVTRISGGTAVNQIPDQATMHLDFRSFDGAELVRFLASLESHLKPHDATYVIPQSGAPVAFDKKSPAVQDFIDAIHLVTGNGALYSDSYGGTDARYFAQIGITTIVAEPHGGGRHAPDEWVLATDLEKFYKLLVTWLIK